MEKDLIKIILVIQTALVLMVIQLAVGAPQNNLQNGIDLGHVRVYKFDGLNWIQAGQDINGIGNGSAGWDVSISGDGSLLILGSPHSSPNGGGSGQALIYQLDSNNWNQIGVINGQLSVMTIWDGILT
jgi:hypothetical protein